ncbi:hypothetical protein [Sansalvadorimonas verongulae]|uniref:hypothetical protein n=1 Tax=Sansalvadorimonas verongulae TaxID=2172824 RepID=UPI0012BC55C2|nr:hypothetical protein [Sansalvadorimonas verongulae]MTI12098.1 hypothetical protein [Sansalvadorimonas verongulae]
MKKASVQKAAALALGMTVASSAMAWGWWDNDKDHNDERGYAEHCMENGKHRGHMKGWFHGDKEQLVSRELTVDQVQTLVEARLIRMGNDNIKVGQVTANDDGYSVTIVTARSGDLVETIELAKNGMPVAMMERWEKRAEHRKN